MTGLYDNYHRRISYMRISVTDRCNMRCIYCNAGRVPHLSHDDILRYSEIIRVVEAGISLGVRSVRITGGEPLVRPNVSELVSMLAQVEGIDDISLTTNGALLSKYAMDLKQAGLKRVNISLDTFKETAKKVGLEPVKINTVVMKGINDDEIVDIARTSQTKGWNVRFIEYMPFTDANEDGNRVVPVKELKDMISASLGRLEPFKPEHGNGPAKYFKLPDATGTVGFIGAMTDCFCAECNRFRLTADGGLRPCLFDDEEVNIKEPLRNGASREELARLMEEAASLKKERHHIDKDFLPLKRQMWQIGG
jgi:cyclic pyranopterin phosphate synthase